MKRIVLFIATNLAVVLLLSVVASLLGVDQFLTQNGLSLGNLLGFSLVFGFGGAFISLLISKQAALWSTGAHVIANAMCSCIPIGAEPIDHSPSIACPGRPIQWNAAPRSGISSATGSPTTSR